MNNRLTLCRYQYNLFYISRLLKKSWSCACNCTMAHECTNANAHDCTMAHAHDCTMAHTHDCTNAHTCNCTNARAHHCTMAPPGCYGPWNNTLADRDKINTGVTFHQKTQFRYHRVKLIKTTGSKQKNETEIIQDNPQYWQTLFAKVPDQDSPWFKFSKCQTFSMYVEALKVPG